MRHFIKQVKPSKSGRYQQGYINPASCKKLFEGLKNDKIIYRSSYEKTFIYWLEQNKNVESWGSECIEIPYYNPLDKSQHTYYPDYVVKMKDGTMLIVEIKPYNQTVKPKVQNGYAWTEWIKNMCKWSAAKKFCQARGILFKILTEKTISKL